MYCVWCNRNVLGVYKMNKLKWIILDNLPTIWIIGVIVLGVVLAADHAGII